MINALKIKIPTLYGRKCLFKLDFGFFKQEIKQGRRAAQITQPQQDAEEDILDAALGDIATENNSAFAAIENDQVC